MPDVVETRIQLNAKPSNELMVNLYAADVDEFVLLLKDLEEKSPESKALYDILVEELPIKKVKKSKKSKDDEDEDEEGVSDGDDDDEPSSKDLKMAKQLKVKGYKDMDSDELKAAIKKALKKGKSKPKKKSKSDDDDDD